MQLAIDLNFDLKFCGFYFLFQKPYEFRITNSGKRITKLTRMSHILRGKMPRLSNLSALLHAFPALQNVIQVQGIQLTDDGEIDKISCFFHKSEGAVEQILLGYA